MKFLKNNLKVIIAFILGLILAGGIVYAATSAKEVTYTTAKNGSIKNVEEALNDLYSKKISIITSQTEVTSGTTITVEKGQVIIVFAPWTITATNATELTDDLRGTIINGIGIFARCFIANGNNVTININGEHNFGYIVIR